MTIYLDNECLAEFPFDPEKIARDVALEALDQVNCPYEAEVSVTIVSAEEIQKINAAQRGIDAPTDVLSFPMTEYPSAGVFDFLEDDPADSFNPDSGELMLGDIVICADRVFSQAAQYGHSVLREYAFLVAHSMLHLVGFDHETKEEAQDMEERQERILTKLHITREL